MPGRIWRYDDLIMNGPLSIPIHNHQFKLFRTRGYIISTNRNKWFRKWSLNPETSLHKSSWRKQTVGAILICFAPTLLLYSVASYSSIKSAYIGVGGNFSHFPKPFKVHKKSNWNRIKQHIFIRMKYISMFFYKPTEWVYFLISKTKNKTSTCFTFPLE